MFKKDKICSDQWDRKLLSSSPRLFLDRAASLFVCSGGFLVILSIAAIFFVIVLEVVPLFKPASLEMYREIEPNIELSSSVKVLANGVDEHLETYYFVTSEGKILFFSATSGEITREFFIPGLAKELPIKIVKAGSESFIAVDHNGLVVPFSVSFSERFEGDVRKVEPDVKLEPVISFDNSATVIDNIAFAKNGKELAIVAQIGRSRLMLKTSSAPRGLFATRKLKISEQVVDLSFDADDLVMQLSRNGELLFLGTSDGQIIYGNIKKNPLRFSSILVGDSSITALTTLNGDETLLVGERSGRVRSLIIKRDYSTGDLELIPKHEFKKHDYPIIGIDSSLRNKSFITLDRLGQINLNYGTSGETLASFSAGGSNILAAISPKSDSVITVEERGKIFQVSLNNPHPEVTLRTIFGSVWYEGRTGPAYIWQSSAASDEVEPKLSLIPLIFGTVKGTVYALLFAVPLAIMAALFVSQFMHPVLRGYIKPIVELMAALPSVVIGFIAGLWLAPRVERVLIGLFISPFILVIAILLGLFIWRIFTKKLTNHLPAGVEVGCLFVVVCCGLWLSFEIGEFISMRYFQGDVTNYLHSALGITYDQRNALLVALAIGFAVIPLIFTITEDGLSAVPPGYVAASLALGATRWQTALRVVLPTASPAIFSAIMIGFGRAVGETMIVLMATGNTPILDWSPFNGFRALSANIAVEMPEAAVGSSLYRVLFLTALILFIITFFVNMLSEIVRIRLRKRYRQG